MTDTVPRVVVKQPVKVAKCMADWRFGINFERNRNLFWNDIKTVRKGKQARNEMVKEGNGQILWDGDEVREKWAEYFEPVLKMEAVKEANINVVGDKRMPVLGQFNERSVSIKEVWEPVNKFRSGKDLGLECLKKWV